MFGEKKKGIREVACLFATRWDKVLLSKKKDDQCWHFPQEEVRKGVDGNPAETPINAIYRIVEKFDGIDEEDVLFTASQEYLSHKGERTEYHIFTTEAKLDHGELRSNGSIYEWDNDPHAKVLNECTRVKLMEYGFFPKT